MVDKTNKHEMITRSKKNSIDESDNISLEIEDYEEMDNDGNLKELIDDNNPELDFDNEMFRNEISRLRGNSPIKNKPIMKKKKRNNKKNNNILELILPYLLLNMVSGGELKPSKLKKKKSKNMEDIIQDLGGHEVLALGGDDIEITDSSDEDGDGGDYDEIDEDEGEDGVDEDDDDECTSSEESETEYDEYDEEFIDLIDNDINEDEEKITS